MVPVRFPEFFESVEQKVGFDGDPFAPAGLPPWFPPQLELVPEDETWELEVWDVRDWQRFDDYFIGSSPDRPPRFGGHNSPSVDAVALYAPWHLWREMWGIYFFQRPFLELVQDTAALAGAVVGRIAPLVLRQVLAHELTHFAFEVTGTEIEDVEGAPRYRGYMKHRYPTTSHWSVGPLEELVATASEIRFARGRVPEWLGPKPPGYYKAARLIASHGPPGYRDFAAFEGSDGPAILAELTSLIGDKSIESWRWGRTWLSERRQVPVYWVGDTNVVRLVGALPKTVGPCTVRRFERWIKRRKGATIAFAMGDHRKFTLPDGRSEGYDSGAPFLLLPEAKRIADLLGLRSARELYDAVAQDRR